MSFFQKILDFPKRKKLKEEVIEKPVEKAAEEPAGRIRKRKLGVAPKVLHSPHIAEKSSYLAEKNQYVFKIFPKANKTEVKKAIEEIYDVDVVGVKIIKVPRKRRRVRRILGWRKGYKKAIVKIKQGQTIEVLPR